MRNARLSVCNMTAQLALVVARTRRDLAAHIARWRDDGLRVGFVPTMGALHEGHLSLVRLAGAHADRVVASVFVNPKQFAPGEDFETYPRDEARDVSLLAGAGCALVYAPHLEEIYPPGAATQVSVSGVGEGLESDSRPHFFTGVATVVTKLLNQVQPDCAVFGEKDYQQLAVIRRLVADLDLGVTILAGPTLREPDGLAMSSRNAYLSVEERRIAGRLNETLFALAKALDGGATPVDCEREGARRLTEAGFDAVDYVAVRLANLTLPPDGPLNAPGRILAAAHLGRTRLIDNVPAGPSR